MEITALFSWARYMKNELSGNSYSPTYTVLILACVTRQCWGDQAGFQDVWSFTSHLWKDVSSPSRENSGQLYEGWEKFCLSSW